MILFDAQIQDATTQQLLDILQQLGPFPAGIEAQDLAMRIVKELRYRRIHAAKPSPHWGRQP